LELAPSALRKGCWFSSVDGLNNVARFLTGWFGSYCKAPRFSYLDRFETLGKVSARAPVGFQRPYSGNGRRIGGLRVGEGGTRSIDQRVELSLEVLFCGVLHESRPRRAELVSESGEFALDPLLSHPLSGRSSSQLTPPSPSGLCVCARALALRWVRCVVTDSGPVLIGRRGLASPCRGPRQEHGRRLRRFSLVF